MLSLPRTAFTDLVGCRLPIQQAGMVGVATPALAAAVAGAGGLGMIAPTGLRADGVLRELRMASAAGGDGGAIGVSFLIPFLDLAAFEAAASETRVVECFYAEPDRALVARAHEGGALVAWQVGSSDEAMAAADAGCDVVIIQGIEAGGHVRGCQPLRALLEATRPAIDIPLVAAGGIGSGRAIADALLAGADAVRIGTRFVATAESGAHRDYIRTLVRSSAEDTVVTEAFAMGWPNAPHRVLRSAVDAVDDPPETRSPLPPDRGFSGPVRSAALYAGTSIDCVTAVSPAAALLDELTNDAAAALEAPDSRTEGH